MNMGAEAEVYNLTELPTAAPAIWKMMTTTSPSVTALKPVHNASDAPSVNIQAAVCT